MDESDLSEQQASMERYNSLVENLRRAENRILYLKSQLDKANLEVKQIKKDLHMAYDDMKRANRKVTSWQEYYAKHKVHMLDILLDILRFLHPVYMGEIREVSSWWNQVIVEHKNVLPMPPPHPKETKTAHSYFLDEFRQNPFVMLVDIRRQSHQAWLKLEDKSRYEKMAEEDQERYLREKGTYEDYQRRVLEIRKEQSEKVFVKPRQEFLSS